MKDPTAKAAARNIAGAQRAARIDYLEDGQPARLWLDPATFRALAALTVTFTDDDGNRHIRFNEKAAQLAHELSGRAPTKGIPS